MLILRIIQAAFAITFTAALIWVLGFLWFASSVVSIQPKEPTMQTDAIIVLTGADKRIQEGVALLDTDLSDKLFITGVNPGTTREELLAFHAPKEIPCCITLGYEARDTNGNATETSQWVSDNNIRSIRLVTSNYHMARSHLEMKQALPDVLIIDHPVTPDDFEPWQKQFWPLTLKEYTKYLGAFIRAGTSKVFA